MKRLNQFSMVALNAMILALSASPASAQRCNDSEIAQMKKAGMEKRRINDLCGAKGSEASASDGRSTAVLQKLASKGDAQAAFELGRRYETGEVVLKDYVQAYVWFARAFAKSSNLGHKKALDDLEAKMLPADIEKAQSLMTSSRSQSVVKPKCTAENVTRWIPHSQVLTFNGASVSKALGFPSQYSACYAAKRDLRSTYDGANMECQSKLEGSEFRSIRGKEIPGECACEDDRDIGMGFSCEYEIRVECEAEKRVVESIQNCF